MEPTPTPVKTVRLGYFSEPQLRSGRSRGWFEHVNNLTSVACVLQSSAALAVSNLDTASTWR